MVSLCLNDEEKLLLKSLIGKKLIKIRHDPLDKFGQETVYGRIELFFEDSIVLIDYDYELYPLFGSPDDEHPRFSIRNIVEDEATSALQDVAQIDVRCNRLITGIALAEDCVEIEWDGKEGSSRVLKAIIFQFGKDEIAIQGDYMMPLLDLIRGENVASKLAKPGGEYENDPEVKYKAERSLLNL